MLEENKEKVLSLIKNGISSIPIIGGALSGILGDHLTEKKIKRVEDFIFKMSNECNKIEDEINQEYIKEDDFVEVFEKTFNYIYNERIAYKREIYKNILLNSMKLPNTTYEDTESFQLLVYTLNVNHIKLLNIFQDSDRYEEGPDSNDLYTNRIIKKAKKVLEIDDEEIILEIAKDLENQNLIDGFSDNYSARYGAGGITNDDYNLVTNKGKRFLKYLQSV
jgi:hypothetical protein